MNTRILASLTMIAVASAGVGYGTYAYFSDTETSVDNLFSAAELNLLLNGASLPVSAAFGAENMAPGESDTGTIALSVVETITGAVDLDVKVVQEAAFDDPGTADPDDGGASSPDLASWLIVDTFGYDAVDLKALADATSDGRPGSVSIQDLINHGTFADNAMPAAVPGSSTLTLTVTFDTAAPNHLKRDSVEIGITFFAAQAAAADLA